MLAWIQGNWHYHPSIPLASRRETCTRVGWKLPASRGRPSSHLSRALSLHLPLNVLRCCWEPGQVKTPIGKETVGRFDDNMFGDCQKLQPARRSLGWRRGGSRGKAPRAPGNWLREAEHQDTACRRSL